MWTTEPTAIFVAERIGYRKNDDLLAELARTNASASLIVRLGDTERKAGGRVLTWREFNQATSQENSLLGEFWAKPHPDDTLCVQFTSGTTGPRKAAMLSHR